jgi:hypothetical protein
VISPACPIPFAYQECREPWIVISLQRFSHDVCQTDMKIPYFAIAVVVIAILGCNKKNDTLHPNLDGTWELASTQGGIDGGQTTYRAGNGNTYIFEENTYAQTIRTSDSTYQSSGTFSIFKAKPCEMSKEEILIRFDGSFSLVFSYTGATFTIGDPHECMSDAMSFTYRRVLR